MQRKYLKNNLLCLAISTLLLLAGRPAFAKTEVIIDPGGSPPEVLQSISNAIDAITRLSEDQDVRETVRLRKRAWDAAHAALQTQGYFNSKVDLDVSTDAGSDDEFWDITINPGPRTKVKNYGIAYIGAIHNSKYEKRRQQLRDAWLLKADMDFIDSKWSKSKTSLLDEIRYKDFYFADYMQTHAVIDPDTNEADLSVLVNSGPEVKLGELQISGLKRVPESLVRRYVHYDVGDSYDQERLDEWQQALQSTPFFWGAFVTLEDGSEYTQDEDRSSDGTQEQADDSIKTATYAEYANSTEPVTLPVKVKVTEGIARSFAGSLGVDSDHGVRVEGLYKQNIINGWPISIETGAGVDKDRQRAFFDVHLPPQLDGSKNSFGLLYDHSDINGLNTRRVGLGWKRQQTRKAAGSSRVEYDVRWSALVAHDKTEIAGAETYEVPSWALTWQWLRRDVNNKYDPREGNLIELGLGVGTTLDDGKPFYRASIRAQQWWSFSERDVITMRGEFGKAWSHTDRVPQDFYWRTGGARSVRGYRYKSIGIERGDAIIGAPVLGVISLEYTHYFTDLLGANVFIDAGDAAPSVKDFKWHLGYGAGLAVLTPAGPFYVDLAWAQKDRRLRLQFSLGIAF